MGWKGKGLGANEDGLTTYVKVDKRQDNRGKLSRSNHAISEMKHSIVPT
jgi:hypothetical protein